MGTFYSDWMFSIADMNIKTDPKGRCANRNFCCIFKRMRVNWSNITVTGISGMTIDMPVIAKVSIFTDNNLTHITDDHFEIDY